MTEASTLSIYQHSSSKGLVLWVLLSMLLHLALLLSYFPVSLLPFFSEGKKDLTVKLAQASVRVDLVAMPKLTVKELRALPVIDQGEADLPAPSLPDTSAAEEQSNEEEFVKKVKKKSLFDRLKQLSNTKIKEKVDKKAAKKFARSNKKQQKRSGISAREQREMRNLLVAGNRLSKGRALVGSSSAESAGEFSSYLDGLPDHVRPYWKLPSYLMGRGFTCRIRIFLKSNGELIKSSIFQSSGNSEFDLKAMRAVKQSAPFPSLASSIGARGVRGDIVLGFPL